MKKIFFLVLLNLMIACKESKRNENEKVQAETDNLELIEIYKNDQNERKSENIDFGELYLNDSLRRVRVNQLLDAGKIKTGKDYARAAMVFQHGKDSVDFSKAVEFIKIAIDKDTTINKWLYAAATDRYLLSKGQPQIYGTQYSKEGDGPWKLDKIDTTKISDYERKKLV